jgi:hypothetical protein
LEAHTKERKNTNDGYIHAPDDFKGESVNASKWPAFGHPAFSIVFIQDSGRAVGYQ